MNMVPAVSESKIVSISAQRQITIPQKFFKLLNFNSEAECILRGSEIVIKPFNRQNNDEFSELILADLLKEGYSGEELLTEFKNRKAKIRPAVLAMIQEADEIAEGKTKSDTFEEVFGSK